jgi:hypothetical protein
MDLLNHREGSVVWFSIRFSLLPLLQCTVTHCRNCKRLREFKEIEISSTAVEATLISKEKNLKTFVWLSS